MELNGVECEKIEIMFSGDSERQTLLKSLKMIVNELETHKYL